MIDIIVARYASREMSNIRNIAAASRVDADTTESSLASSPEFIKESDFTFTPTFFTYCPSIIFTITATPTIIKDYLVYDGVTGLIIFFIASTKEVIPAYKTITEIIIALRYSILP